MIRPNLSFTKFTSITPKLFSKRFSLDDGKLIKSSSADMSEGQAKLMTCFDLKEFNDLRAGLTSSQALCYGIAPEYPDVSIRAADKLQPGDIARTKEYFKFDNGPGIMMFDHDNTVDGIPIEAEDLRNRLLQAVPELANAPMLMTVSASSCISNSETGEVLSGIKGQRIYLAVANASLIPEAGKKVFERLWAADMGWIEVGKAGQALPRTLIDACVFQSNRLDFAGPPELGESLSRTVPAPRFFNLSAQPFDLRCIKNSPEVTRKAQAAMALAKNNAKPRLLVAKTAYVAAKAPEMATRLGISIEAAQTTLQSATDTNVLGGNFELYSQDGAIVTVAQLLDDPGKWHNKNFADPLEPDYGNSNLTVARAYLKRGTKPCIRSFAHGGITYAFRGPSKRIQLAVGERARINDDILEAIREANVYDLGEGGGMTRVCGTTAIPVTREWLAQFIDRECAFFRVKVSDSGETVERAADAPPNIASAIISMQGERRLPVLDAVITAPTLRRDGSVLDEPGHDKASGLLFLSEGEGLKVPVAPTPEQALAALQRLWAPVAQFPFVEPTDRAVMLAAMLTAVLRGSLPAAPGFAFDAPSAGSGKTLLATIVGILALGHEPPISPPCGQEDEMRKRLFASLRDGQRVVLWDNLRDPLGGASLDAFLTAPTFSDRVLGVSGSERLPNRALFLCTGNNVRVVGDTNRRVLVSRIDPKSEKPFAREFTFDPATVVKNQRQQLVVDALTIVRAYITAGSPRPGKGRTASFDLWDDLVRQSVIWISNLAAATGFFVEFGDPLDAVSNQKEIDPETQKLDALMTSWDAEFGSDPTTVAKAIVTANVGNQPLRAALDQIAGQHGVINPRIFGSYIQRHRGRPLNGRCFERGTVRNGNQQWIVRCEKPETPMSATAIEPIEPT